LGSGARIDGLGIGARSADEWRPAMRQPVGHEQNGSRTPEQLLKHIKTEPLVKWAFDPGIRPNGEQRTTPPLTQKQLIKAFEKWIAEGTPCPTQ